VALPELDEDSEDDEEVGEFDDHIEGEGEDQRQDHSYGKERRYTARSSADKYPEVPAGYHGSNGGHKHYNVHIPTISVEPERYRGLLSPIEPAATPTSAQSSGGYDMERTFTCAGEYDISDVDHVTNTIDGVRPAERSDNPTVAVLETGLSGVLIEEAR